ncbi:hypothetical protein ACF065_33785 [Streptomyces sp. NPDC015232]|uniref:hypothetical protein n=1 Tax=unclassified Streptomyces TaxID=2593676 RepID=UPI0036F5DD0C
MSFSFTNPEPDRDDRSFSFTGPQPTHDDDRSFSFTGPDPDIDRQLQAITDMAHEILRRVEGLRRQINT